MNYKASDGVKNSDSAKKWVLLVLLGTIAFIGLFANNCYLLWVITGGK